MKAFLMFRDRDFEMRQPLPAQHEALIQDLELPRLLGAMALGDPFLFEVCERALLALLDDPNAIVYRQEVLRDCLDHPGVVREFYDLAVEAIQREKQVWGLWRGSPDSILHRSVRVLGLLMDMLRRLRRLIDEHAGEFRSAGFTTFFHMLATELDSQYFMEVEDHLRQLRFREGVLISAELGTGNKGVGHVLHRLRHQGLREWVEQELGVGRSANSFRVADRDEAGMRALEDLRGRGINLVANALAQSTDHILSFFAMLRAELGFYIGCANLHRRLAEKGEPVCFPEPLPPGRPALYCRGLYDVCLSLVLEERVVGNDVEADGRLLVMITGANRGGKSTFLRSAGLAQLMMQCGMFTPAESFRADVCRNLFTHFKREEDATMRSGKLDEELSRMSGIADRITSGCMLLCNESFASTNEREGSEIARQIVRALLDRGVKVLFVTHMYDLAQGLHSEEMGRAAFLRADREPDGRRTYRLIAGEPLPTSHGADVFGRVFGQIPEGTPTATPDATDGSHDPRPARPDRQLG